MSGHQYWHWDGEEKGEQQQQQKSEKRDENPNRIRRTHATHVVIVKVVDSRTDARRAAAVRLEERDAGTSKTSTKMSDTHTRESTIEPRAPAHPSP